MIEFVKPTNLNGKELLEELAAGGVTVTGRPNVELEVLRLDIKASDKSNAEKIILAHNGTTTAPDLTAEKQAILQKLGITADEISILLG